MSSTQRPIKQEVKEDVLREGTVIVQGRDLFYGGVKLAAHRIGEGVYGRVLDMMQTTNFSKRRSGRSCYNSRRAS